MIHWLMDLGAPARYTVLAILGVWGCAGMWWVLLRATRSGEQAAERTEELAQPYAVRSVRDLPTWRRYCHRGKHHKPRWWNQLTSGLVTWDH